MFSTPAHKQVDPAKLPAQRVEPVGYPIVRHAESSSLYMIGRASEKAANFRDSVERDADNVKAQELRAALAEPKRRPTPQVPALPGMTPLGFR